MSDRGPSAPSHDQDALSDQLTRRDWITAGFSFVCPDADRGEWRPRQRNVKKQGILQSKEKEGKYRGAERRAGSAAFLVFAPPTLCTTPHGKKCKARHRQPREKKKEDKRRRNRRRPISATGNQRAVLGGFERGKKGKKRGKRQPRACAVARKKGEAEAESRPKNRKRKKGPFFRSSFFCCSPRRWVRG